MERLEISAMTLGPYGVGHVAGKTILVTNTVPGDVIEAEIIAERHDYATARIVRLVHGGAVRREAPCPYLPACGGCDWQTIDYPAQVRIKSDLLAAELQHALGFAVEPADLIAAASAEFGYRSRVRLKTGRGGAIGYRQADSNTLVAIGRCLVAATDLEVAARLSRLLGDRCVEIEVVGGDRGQVLLVQMKRAPAPREEAIACRLIDAEPRLTGIILRGGEARSVIGDVTIAVAPESDCLITADADCFSQINHVENRKLVAAVMEMIGGEAGTPVLDLFCGVGNFSLPAARRGAAVTGVDADERAIAAARDNAARMELRSAQFVAMPAAATARFLHRASYRPAIVILDPPRTGALALMDTIGRLQARMVIYVSCDPATLVRDLAPLVSHGYQLATVRGFDFFPNTHHVEAVAQMVLT